MYESINLIFLLLVLQLLVFIYDYIDNLAFPSNLSLITFMNYFFI